jgi:hypothetical protein
MLLYSGEWCYVPISNHAHGANNVTQHIAYGGINIDTQKNTMQLWKCAKL